jgi:hypothetical protein
MSTQTRDGTWTPPEPIEEALTTLRQKIFEGTAKRFVIGQTSVEVEREQAQVALADTIKDLSRRLDRLEATSDQAIIRIPTADEIAKLMSKENE